MAASVVVPGMPALLLAIAAIVLCLCLATQAFADPKVTTLESRDQSSGIALHTQANSIADASGRNWMSKLPDNIPVSSISIPGTHDSATKWTKLDIRYSSVQEQPIGEWSYPYIYPFYESTEHFDGQLNCGVRYFDLRIAKKNADQDYAGELYLLHGYHFNEAQLCTRNYTAIPGDYKTLLLGGVGEDDNGDGVDDGVWPWFEDFLQKNPSETIIVDFNSEADGKKEDVYEFFRNKAFEERSIVWKGDHVPTLGEARGKVILFSSIGYGMDKFKYGDSDYWALPVSWGPGDKEESEIDNNGIAKYGEGANYEIWGQNVYEGLIPSTKWRYVESALKYDKTDGNSGENWGCFSAEVRDNALSFGRNAWIANFLSGNSIFKGNPWAISPKSYYTEMLGKDGKLKNADWFSDQALQTYWQDTSGTGMFTGIMAMDFVTAAEAKLIYRVNFYSYGPANYEWSNLDDPDKCMVTATRSIMGDGSKAQTATISANNGKPHAEITKEPWCTETGTVAYTADFKENWAFRATATGTLPALGHDYEYKEGNASNTIVYRCKRCGDTATLTLKAESKPYDGVPIYPSEPFANNCTLEGLDKFNEAMGTNLFNNNIKLYKDGLEIAQAQDLGTYAARIYIDDTHYAECAFTVGESQVTVWVDDATKTFGDADPKYRYIARGDSYREDIEGNEVVISRSPGENIGEYRLTASIPGNPNYTVKVVAETTGSAYPKLTIEPCNVDLVGIKVKDKVYDGTTVAELDTSGMRIVDHTTDRDLSNVGLKASATASFESANVKTGLTWANIGNLQLGGDNAKNYRIYRVNDSKPEDAVSSAHITPRPVKVWALAQGLLQGGSIDSSVAHAVATGTGEDASGLLAEHTLSSIVLSAEPPTIATPVTDIVASDARVQDGQGADVTGNYTFTYENDVAYLIDPNDETPRVKPSLVYDGGAQALVECGNGRVEYSLDGTTWKSDIPKATDAGIYTVRWRFGGGDTVVKTLPVTIARRPLAVTPKAGQSKLYGDDDPASFELEVADGDQAGSGGLVAGHTISGLARTAGEDAGSYPFAADGLKVVDGANVDVTANYAITFSSGSFTIDPRPVRVSGIKAETKVYNGDAFATLDYSDVAFDGLLEGDSLVAVAVGKFDDKAAGAGKPVRIELMDTLLGNSGRNYVLAADGQQTETTATIVPKPVAVSGLVVGQDGCKAYDGSTEIAIDATNASFGEGGVCEGDQLGVSDTGLLPNPNVGMDKNVAIELTGADAGNYELIVMGPNTRYTATVTSLPVTVTGVTAADKVYDGTTTVALDATGAAIAGVLDADLNGIDVSATGAFESADAGAGKTVNIELSLTGSSAGNYQLAEGSQTSASATISKRPLVVGADDQAIDYGEEVRHGPAYATAELAPADGSEAKGLVGGHYLGGISLAANEDAETIVPSGAKILARGSGDASAKPVDCTGNYDIVYENGKLTVSILVSLPDGMMQTYDGTEHVLVEAGAVQDGFKMQYAALPLAENDGSGGESADDDSWEDSLNWQDTPPQAKDAGIYYIAYRIVENATGQPVDVDWDTDHMLALIVRAASRPCEVVIAEGGEGTWKVASDNLAAVMEDVLDEEEKAAVDAGASAALYLVVTPLPEPPAADRQTVAPLLSELGATEGAWADFSLVLKVTGRADRIVTEADKAVEISVTVPEALHGDGRTFWLIRCHGGKADSIATTEGGVLEGESKLFSSYLVACKAPELEPDPEPSSSTGSESSGESSSESGSGGESSSESGSGSESSSESGSESSSGGESSSSGSNDSSSGDDSSSGGGSESSGESSSSSGSGSSSSGRGSSSGSLSTKSTAATEQPATVARSTSSPSTGDLPVWPFILIACAAGALALASRAAIRHS